MISITSKSVYALSALVELAHHEGGDPIPVSEIARRRELPAQFLEQLFGTLRRANIVTSRRGVKGGYVLATPGGRDHRARGRPDARRRRSARTSFRSLPGARSSARCASSLQTATSRHWRRPRRPKPAERCTTSDRRTRWRATRSSERHRPDGRHAARRAQAPVRRTARHGRREARDVQSRPAASRTASASR